MVRDVFDSGIPRAESDLFARIFNEAAERMRNMILHPKGKTQASREWRQARAAEQILQVRKIAQQMGIQISRLIGDDNGKPGIMTRIVRESVARANRQAVEAGVRSEVVRGSFSVVDTRSVAVVIRDTVAAYQQATNSMVNRTERLLRSTSQENLSETAINDLIVRNVIDGDPAHAKRALRDELIRVNKGQMVTVRDKNGGTINYKAGYYADMVIRTRTRQVTAIARHERLAELGLDLVRIVGRISDNYCTSFLGQVFSLSGKHPKYPPLASIPGGFVPFHPNCSKSTAPIVLELASEERIAQAELIPDAGKLLGMDPTEAQKQYKAMQLRQQVQKHYVGKAA